MGYFVVMILMVVVAILAFIDIQSYLQMPDLKKHRKEWFARFQEFNNERYSDPKLAWRYNALEAHFAKSPLEKR